MTQSITVYEAAQILHTNARYVRTLISRKKLKARAAEASGKLKVYLIDKKSVKAYRKGHPSRSK